MDHILKTIEDTPEHIEKENYTISSLNKEVLYGDTRGWILGHFYPPNSRFKRDDIEIAVKVLEEDFMEEPHYHICPFELVLILDGIVEYKIDKDIHTLKPGMFYIMEPYTVACVTKVHKKAVALCVRLPSLPNSKIVVNK